MSAPDFTMDNGTGREVVPGISITNLLAQRDAVLTKVAEGCRLLREAQAIADDSGIANALRYKDFHWILAGPDRYNRDTQLLDEDVLPGIAKRLDAAAWDLLMHESGVVTLMDAKARKAWRDAIDKCETLELTRENIASTFAGLHEQRGEIFERGVIECFRRLSWDYKTNRPFKFGKRLVLRFVRYSIKAERGGGTQLGCVNHRVVDELDDLSRVLHILDGKPEPDHRQGWHTRLGLMHRTTDPDPEDAYIRVRCFRNGNGHLTFKRLELVEKMNRILAKHYPGALAHDQHTEGVAA